MYKLNDPRFPASRAVVVSSQFLRTCLSPPGIALCALPPSPISLRVLASHHKSFLLLPFTLSNLSFVVETPLNPVHR